VPNPKQSRSASRAGATRALVLVALVGLVATLLPACSKSKDKSEASSTTLSRDASAPEVARAYVAAWGRRDYKAMAELVDPPAAPIAALDQKLVTDLGITSATHTAGKIVQTKVRATLPVTNHYVVDGLGAWSAEGVVTLSHRTGHWLVAWSPRQVANELQTGYRITTTLTWPERAPILGVRGALLTGTATVVTVGIQGSRIKDKTALATVLQQSGAPAAAVTSALATAAVHPDWFVPVYDLNAADYARLKPKIYPIGGTVFHTRAVRTPITGELAAHIVGKTGPITAEQLQKLGKPYVSTDTVGRSGLESVYEHQLAGSPGATIEVVSATGAHVATIAKITAKPGTPVRTTIEPAVQRAAEAAVAAVPGAAAIVAIRPSTGAVIATVSHPTSGDFNIAFNGQYPPGSTFKIVTSADLLQNGLTPSSPASCPATITIDGRVFHNFEGESAGPLTLEQAFAHSCNAAFIGLAQRLSYATFAPAAAQFGLGTKRHMGLDAFGGSVPAPVTQTERAETAIGQARVVVSPLSMAAVAASVASGAFRPPRLVIGAPDDKIAPKPIDPKVISGLRTMMAAVVAYGTGAGHGLPAGTFGKTGTAEFGTENPPATHAWFVGYRGDVAFAVLVVGGGVGGRVAAPIAATFLNSLGP
jgi:cell division protein FtsI/penicillin-binding protein 2